MCTGSLGPKKPQELGSAKRVGETRKALSVMDQSEREDCAERETVWRCLMVQAQDGDKVAYARLLTEILPVLRRYVGHKWRDRDEVEDIVQDILLSLHDVRHTFDPGRDFMPWLMTIASRRIADAARRNASRFGHETTVDTMPETSGPLPTKYEQDISDDRQQLLSALDELSPAQREAVRLMKIEGASLQEASALTGRSTASLKTTVHRALKTMRQSMERKS